MIISIKISDIINHFFSVDFCLEKFETSQKYLREKSENLNSQGRSQGANFGEVGVPIIFCFGDRVHALQETFLEFRGIKIAIWCIVKRLLGTKLGVRPLPPA